MEITEIDIRMFRTMQRIRTDDIIMMNTIHLQNVSYDITPYALIHLRSYICMCKRI